MKDQYDEQHGVEEVGTEEHRSQVEEDGEEDNESESGLWGHTSLPQNVHDSNPSQFSKSRGSSNPVWDTCVQSMII
jgi:hypothetical protein